jgi:phosphomannomutase / phosphoglucomutase
MLDPVLFREYDIRGRSPELLDAETARLVARALGTRIRKRGGADAVVGRDVRPTSPDLAAAAIEGLASTGLLVHDVGIAPTPVVYHAAYRLRSGGSLMVTGSHNPPSDNGLKACVGTESLYGDGVRSLRDEALEERFATGDGKREDRSRWLEAYAAEMVARFAPLPPLKVVVDCGNGVAGPLVVDVLSRVGLKVTPLFCDQDGTFPNHIPDPEVPKYMETLRRRVVDDRADFGLGFDGDGDRVGVIDETGTKISADRLIAVFAAEILATHPGGVVRYDVKCGDFLADVVRKHGGTPVMGKTGHSLLKRDVKEADAVFGGELSGHLLWNRGYPPIDDALFAALMFVRLVARSGRPASSLFSELPKTFGTAEIKTPCADDVKFRVVDEAVATLKRDYEVFDLDGARVRLKDAWFLVRASNTTPNLTVRFEGESREAVLRARDLLVSVLRGKPVDTAPLFDET